MSGVLQIPAGLAAWLAEGVPQSTRRVYAGAWRRWCSHCEQWSQCPMPANPADVAAYCRQLTERGAGASTVNVALAAIARAHTSAQHADPCAHPLVRMARRRVARADPRAVHQAREVTLAELRTVVDMLAVLAEPLQRTRNTALVLTTWWGALRRSEACNLRVGDVTFVDGGATLRIVNAKTTDGAVQVALPSSQDARVCPVAALQAWLSAAPAPEDAPLFRSFDGAGRLTGRMLTPEGFRLMLATYVGTSSPHGLRAGVATELHRRGVGLVDVMRAGRWRSVSAATRYIRGGAAVELAPTRGLAD